MLNQQISHLHVGQGGSANWIPLVPGVGAKPVSNLGELLEISVDVLGRNQRVTGGIRLYENEGFLSVIDLFELSGKVPRAFPRPHQLRVHPWRDRPLTHDERAVLTMILEAFEHPERQTLIAQVPFLRATASSIATWTNLVADAAAVPAIDVDSPISVNADVMDAAGEPIGGIVLFVENGLISAIDFFWYGDDRPAIFPHPWQIRFRPVDDWG